MSFRIASVALRAASRHSLSSHPQTRAFHSPFAVLDNSPLTSPPPKESNNTITSHYEKQYDHPLDTSSSSIVSGEYRTYVVSEPDAHSRHYQVPAGAYPTSAPYVNFTATAAPDTAGMQHSSTSSAQLAHGVTTRAATQHAGGVGESSAVRNASSPGEMGVRGGELGGLGLMDKQGTQDGANGGLAERNPQPDGSVAEKFSKAGVHEAWKLRK